MDKLTIISDPGVDDLVALVLLDKLTKGRPKTLVSTFGNTMAEITSVNAERFAAWLGGDWRFRQGAAQPLNGEVPAVWLDAAQGSDGLWGCRPAPTRRAAADMDNGGGRIISLAPLTEAYQLLRGGLITDLLVMGGLFAGQGNNEPAEFNVRLDVEAARWLFANCRNCRVTVVPANVAEGVRWTKAMISAIPETTPANSWLKQLLLSGYESGRYAPGNDFILYDPLAVYLLFRPDRAQWGRRGVRVIGSGARRGRTVFSNTSPPCTVALSIAGPEAVAAEIFAVMFGDDDGKY